MRGRILWGVLGLAGIGLLATGAVFFLHWQAERQLDQALAGLRAALPDGVTLTIGHHEIGLVDRIVEVVDIVLDDARPTGSKLAIAHLRLDQLDPDVGQAIRFRDVELRDITLTDKGDGTRIAIDTLTAGGADLPVAALTGGLTKLDQFRFSGAELTGAKLTAADGGLELAKLTLIDLNDGMLWRAVASGFHMSFLQAGLGRVELAAAVADGSEIALGAVATGNFSGRPEGLLDSFGLAEASATAAGGKLSLHHVRYAVTTRDSAGRPTASASDIEGLLLYLPQIAPLSAVLAKLGTPDLALTSHGEERFDPAARTESLSELVGVDHAGLLRLDASLGNLPEPAATDPADRFKMTIGPVRFAWTDQGLIPAVEAALMPDLPDQAETEIQDRLKALGAAETTGDWPGKLATFLRKPGRIEFDLSPVKAVELGTLFDESLPPSAKFGLLQPSLKVETAP